MCGWNWICSVLVSSLTTRPKISAVLVPGSMIRDSPSTTDHYTRNKVVIAIKYSLIHYFTILSPGYQKSDYISYAVLLIMFLSIMFLSNILLCTISLFIDCIIIPIGVYVSLRQLERFTHVTVKKFDHCRSALSCPQRWITRTLAEYLTIFDKYKSMIQGR